MHFYNCLFPLSNFYQKLEYPPKNLYNQHIVLSNFVEYTISGVSLMKKVMRFGVLFLAFVLLLQTMGLSMGQAEDRSYPETAVQTSTTFPEDGGNRWPEASESVRLLPQPAPLFDDKNGNPVATIGPQLIRILAQNGAWFRIATDLGPRWINLQTYASTFVPSERPQPIGRHFMSWQFPTYLEPDFRAPRQELHDPQIVTILELRGDGWAYICTYRGTRWIYIRGNLRYVEREFSLFDEKGGRVTARVAPQVVTILEQDGNWFLISTYVGPRWTNLTAPRPPAGNRLVALTFDDGPSIHTERLLDALAARNVPATFYVLGRQVEARPQIARRIVTEGHEIANHSLSHPQLSRLSAAGVRDQLIRTSDIIYRATGVRPTNMRPPYGAQNQTVRNVAAERGYPVVLWSIDTLDWRHRNVPAIMSHIVDRHGNIRVRDGDIILMHDVHAPTIDAAIRTVDLLLANGFTFVTVSELFEARGGGTPGRVYTSMPR